MIADEIGRTLERILGSLRTNSVRLERLEAQERALGGDAVVQATGTNSDTFEVNADHTDADAKLILGRATGGSASVTWNGSLITTDKPLAPSDLIITRIQHAEPIDPVAGMFWLQTP